LNLLGTVAALCPVTSCGEPQTTIEELAVNYTHYDYLELAPGASTARIEAAYAQLLERFGYGSTDAGQDMSGLVRMIHAAYEILSDMDARRRYDAMLNQETAIADAELKASLDQQASRTARRVQDVPAPLQSAFRALAA
jgi:DnaJ-class molecular chaperone